MKDADSISLQVRLQRIERRLHVVLMGWGLSVLVLALLGIAVQKAATQPSTVRAQSFEIVDKTGMARVLLGMTSDGSPGLRIRDSKGQCASYTRC
jgi:hypothetical protein